MRRIILLGLFALLVGDASAQRRGVGFGRGGFGRGRFTFSRGFGYGYLPYGDLPYDAGDYYGYTPQPVGYASQPIIVVQPASPPMIVKPPRPVHPVVTDYKWPTPGSAPMQSEAVSQPQSFGIVLRDGSTLSAVTVMASDDVLHYVDQGREASPDFDERSGSPGDTEAESCEKLDLVSAGNSAACLCTGTMIYMLLT